MSQDKLELIRRAAPGVLPSLLMCDFGDLKSELDRLQQAGTKCLHLDVMDGQFVPNLTYGMPIVEGIRKHSDLPMDVHLMIKDPLAYAKPMIDAGADSLTFHVEAVEDAAQAAREIKSLGACVGVALNPSTPLEALDGCLDEVDMVLVMSVDAGFGGQAFNPIALERLQTLKQSHPDLLLEIDGGINRDTIGQARAAGCDLFVVGSAIFKHQDYSAAIADLNAQMSGGQS
ncbi:MAG: ribulose-phosphate 3-epimerase [Rhodopirellula sp. TMED11]|nr:MAG: ribulose-phosphate 3-epimerase [Rhodopirellula sp. TMED11]